MTRGSYGLYEVTGRRPYRGHKPGTRFEARLEPMAEKRAVRRGDITLLERVVPTLAPGSTRLPDDWPPPGVDAPASQGRREAPLSSGKE